MIESKTSGSASRAVAQKISALLRERRSAGGPSGRNSPLVAPARWGLRHVRRLHDRRMQAAIARAQRLLRADNIVLRVPDFRGVFELQVRNNLTRCLLQGGFERTLARIFETVLAPGMHIIDIGANVGLYSVLAAQLVGSTGRVLAAEPVPTMVELLRSNVARNRLPQVEIFAGAVTSEQGTCSIEFVEGGEEYSSLGSIAHPDVPRQSRRRVDVPGETLDELVAKHGLRPALVKVDTEGAEGLVFSGATCVLDEFRPAVTSELDDRLLGSLGYDSGKVINLFAQRKYRVFNENTGEELSFGASRGPFIGEIVALPQEACT
jgi:FkbM family methyltransferase